MLRNLVDFALSSPLPTPPRLMFISSTDTLRGASNALKSTPGSEAAGSVAVEGPVNACDAAGGMHGESKWVGEQILVAAASETPLRPIIVRVGPLCGAANGRWREESHLPTIVHLGVALGALPKIDEVGGPFLDGVCPGFTSHTGRPLDTGPRRSTSRSRHARHHLTLSSHHPPPPRLLPRPPPYHQRGAPAPTHPPLEMDRETGGKNLRDAPPELETRRPRVDSAATCSPRKGSHRDRRRRAHADL